MKVSLSREDARLIIAATRRFQRFLLQACGGKLPDTVEGFEALCRSFHIWPGAIDCPESFTAKLWYCEESDLWTIGYNWRGTDAQVCRWICHELFEWFAVSDFIHLFDDLPGTTRAGNAASNVYYYDGGSDPYSLHHQIAKRGEWICFRRY